MGARVLLVEDHEPTRTALRELLRNGCRGRTNAGRIAAAGAQ